MREYEKAWLLAAVICGLPGAFIRSATAQTPSFSCERASTSIENAICGTPVLATADTKMATAYKAALAASYADQSAVREEQLVWLRDRDKRCQTNDRAHATTDQQFLACLEQAYDQRISQLAAPLESNGACRAVASALRAAADVDVLRGQSVADIAAGVTGSALRLDKRIGGGYTLESTYAGSLSCQLPHLFHTTGDGKLEISVPEEFAPEEGSHCGADRVRLASVNGIPGLLHESTTFGGSGRSATIGISLRLGTNWTTGCSLTVSTRAMYHVAVASCSGDHCGPLTDLAEQYSNAHHGLLEGKSLPSVEDLSSAQQAEYREISRAATTEDLARSPDVPSFGASSSGIAQQGDSYCSSNFDGSGGEFFPVVFDGQVMLGKIGHDGFGLGAHSGGPNDAIAIYRLAAGKLQPIGGFCVVVQHQRIASVHVN